MVCQPGGRGDVLNVEKPDALGVRRVVTTEGSCMTSFRNPSGNPRLSWRAILLQAVKERTARLRRHREWQTHPARAIARLYCARC